MDGKATQIVFGGLFCGEPIYFERTAGPLTVSGDPDTVEMFEEWLTATLRQVREFQQMRLRWVESDFVGYLRANP